MSTIFAKRIGKGTATPIETPTPLKYVGIRVNIGIKSPGNPGNIINVENIGDDQFHQAKFWHVESMDENIRFTNSNLKDLYLQCIDNEHEDFVKITSI